MEVGQEEVESPTEPYFGEDLEGWCDGMKVRTGRSEVRVRSVDACRSGARGFTHKLHRRIRVTHTPNSRMCLYILREGVVFGKCGLFYYPVGTINQNDIQD
jgi:hypothetical protein